LASMNSIPLSLSIVSGFLFMGQFLTPIMIKFLQDVFSYENVESPFVISFFIGMFAVIALVVNRRVKFYDENRIHY
jgi:fucose permease